MKEVQQQFTSQLGAAHAEAASAAAAAGQRVQAEAAGVVAAAEQRANSAIREAAEAKAKLQQDAAAFHVESRRDGLTETRQHEGAGRQGRGEAPRCRLCPW